MCKIIRMMYVLLFAFGLSLSTQAVASCPNEFLQCVYQADGNCNIVGNLPNAGTCWEWPALACWGCEHSDEQCNRKYHHECQGQCFAMTTDQMYAQCDSND